MNKKQLVPYWENMGIAVILRKVFRPSISALLLIIVWSFFQIKIASTVYIAFIILVEGFILFIDKVKKLDINSMNLSDKEFNILQKYHIYFTCHSISVKVSPILSVIQMSTFILVPWFIYNRYLWQSIFITVNYLVSAHFAFKLNPHLFLHEHIKGRTIVDIPPDNLNKIKDFIRWENEMEILNNLSEKILSNKIHYVQGSSNN